MGDRRIDRTGCKCGSCVWRAPDGAPHKCDFAAGAGQTRRAESPRACTYYLQGRRVGEGEERRAAAALEKVLAQRSAEGLA